MGEVMKLSLADYTLIHALGLISRPEIIASQRADLELQVEILRAALPMTSKGNQQLQPLISVAGRIARARPLRPGNYGSLHDEASVAMNRWDRFRMAEAWDRIQGGSR